MKPATQLELSLFTLITTTTVYAEDHPYRGASPLFDNLPIGEVVQKGHRISANFIAWSVHDLSGLCLYVAAEKHSCTSLEDGMKWIAEQYRAWRHRDADERERQK